MAQEYINPYFEKIEEEPSIFNVCKDNEFFEW